LRNFFADKRVLIFGHTSYRGAWLSLVLSKLGADVFGISAESPARKSLFTEIDVEQLIRSEIVDYRNYVSFNQVIDNFDPQIIVFISPTSSFFNHSDIKNLYSLNTLGILNTLDYFRHSESGRIFVNLIPGLSPGMMSRELKTENSGEIELIRGSFFSAAYLTKGYRLAYEDDEKLYLNLNSSEVMGGGDWSGLSLVNELSKLIFKRNDIIEIVNNETHKIVHILDLINGLLQIIKDYYTDNTINSKDISLFPGESHILSEQNICDIFKKSFDYIKIISDTKEPVLSNSQLFTNSMNFSEFVNWKPVISVEDSINLCVEWENAWNRGADMQRFTLNQISDYLNKNG
jgi:CDP-glucose 4,6-dehydratase